MNTSETRTAELDATYTAREKQDGANAYRDHAQAVMDTDEPEVEQGAPSSLNGIARSEARGAQDARLEPAYGEASMEQDDQAEAHRGA